MGGSVDGREGGVPGGVVDSAATALALDEAKDHGAARHSHGKGTTLGWLANFPSSQSTTLFRSVTLTRPPVSPLSRACFMYSVTEASLSSHVTYIASSVKKSPGLVDGSDPEVPGFRNLVGVDFDRV